MTMKQQKVLTAIKEGQIRECRSSQKESSFSSGVEGMVEKVDFQVEKSVSKGTEVRMHTGEMRNEERMPGEKWMV